MPTQFLAHINSVFLQLAPVLAGLTLLLWLLARAKTGEGPPLAEGEYRPSGATSRN